MIHVGQLELLLALGQVVVVERFLALAVAHHPLRDWALGLDAVASQCVVDHGLEVKAVVESFADVDVAEKVGRDAVAVQCTTAGEGIAALEVDIPVELGWRLAWRW